MVTVSNRLGMPNVALITIDSLRKDHVSYHGHHRCTTPFLDKFANENTIYTNAFSQGHSTRLSFPAILGSRYALEEGYESAPQNVDLVSEKLSEAGITTAAFHSNPYLSEQFGYDRGFGEFYSGMKNQTATQRIQELIINNFNSDGLIHKALRRLRSTFEKSKNGLLARPYVKAEDITNKVVGWINQTEKNDNFLWVHYMDPHSPFSPPKEDQKEVLGEVIPSNVISKLRNKYPRENNDLSEKDIQYARDLYDAEVHYTDRCIRKLVNKIKQKWNDTMFIITSDHGEEFRDHGKLGHKQLYDETIRVPLIIDKNKNNQKEDKVESLTGLINIAPTINKHFGVESPDKYLGYSLLNTKNQSKNTNNHIITEGLDVDKDPAEPLIAIRGETYKCIIRNSRIEVYNIDNDPGEKNNLSGAKEREEVKKLINKAEEHSLKYESINFKPTDIDNQTKNRLKDLGYI